MIGPRGIETELLAKVGSRTALCYMAILLGEVLTFVHTHKKRLKNWHL